MKDNRHILSIVVVMVLVSFMSLSFAVSYSYIIQAKANRNTVKAVTTNMDFTSTITRLTGAEYGFYPDTSKYATIQFAKPSGYSTHYYIVFVHTSTSVNATNQANFIPFEDLYVQLFAADSNGAPTSTAVTQPTRIADNFILSSSPTYANAQYIIHEGILNSTTTSKKIAAVIWGDPEKASLYDSATVDISIYVYQYPLYHSSYHNFSGYVYDSSNNPVSGASVIFQNVLVATTNSSGAYTIPNVPIGTWTLDVIDNNNNQTYSTTMRVAGDPSVTAITQPGPYSYTATQGWYVQRAANTRYTTTYKIIKTNNLSTNSNYIPSVAYTTPKYNYIRLPDTYDNSPLSNVNIKFDTGNTLTLTYVAS
ncbi:MAG: carboxypeptidase regulatory-like domain-containing protein [Bacilli bacterium]|nr:carboxypeptidase regulatory-like domain-containing protein [Bacilli bacterium]